LNSAGTTQGTAIMTAASSSQSTRSMTMTGISASIP
jgi:hypothetical protein